MPNTIKTTAPHLENTISYGNILVVIAMIISGVVGYTKVIGEVESNTSKIAEIRRDLASNNSRIIELEKNNIRTTVLLEQIFGILEKTDTRLTSMAKSLKQLESKSNPKAR